MVVMLLVEILLFNHVNLRNGTETVRSCINLVNAFRIPKEVPWYSTYARLFTHMCVLFYIFFCTVISRFILRTTNFGQWFNPTHSSLNFSQVLQKFLNSIIASNHTNISKLTKNDWIILYKSCMVAFTWLEQVFIASFLNFTCIHLAFNRYLSPLL